MPPGASRQVRGAARRLAAPVEQFLHHETSSGVLLLGTAIVALIWANSAWSESYVHLWHTPVTIGVGDWAMSRSLHFWINDFLMTFFFMVAGFEIKREMVEGELSDLRRGALPIAGAVGGMLAPALIYFGFNPSGPTASGWGVPMATDIAFAIGALTLLGKRVPAALRILLLALAIIDDIGAILVIALFYSSGFAWSGMVVVGAGLLVLLLFRALGIRPGGVYFIPLIIIWAGLYQCGVHPTLAGVIVGMSAPVKPWLDKDQFLYISQRAIDDYAREAGDGSPSNAALLGPLRRLGTASREAVAPVVRLQTDFHPWVAFLIMPLFSLANAGVDLGGVELGDPGALSVVLGVGLGLVLGKPLGILGVSWLLVRLGVVTLPRGVSWLGMLVLGICAGIGFTMAIFVAELAFKGSAESLGIAKLTILTASAGAAVLALALGRFALPRELDPEVAAKTPADAEASTEF